MKVLLAFVIIFENLISDNEKAYNFPKKNTLVIKIKVLKKGLLITCFYFLVVCAMVTLVSYYFFNYNLLYMGCQS